MDLKNNQGGFTIIELITSFSLTMVVLIFLFNIVLIMKETYVSNSTKSDLIINQSLISVALNEDLYNEAVSFTSTTCGSGYDKCYNVVLSDGSNKKLSISSSNSKKKIKYGDVELSDDSFDNLDYNICYYKNSATSSNLDSFVNIKITIDSNVIENQTFGINVVYPYDSESFSVSGLSTC